MRITALLSESCIRSRGAVPLRALAVLSIRAVVVAGCPTWGLRRVGVIYKVASGT